MSSVKDLKKLPISILMKKYVISVCLTFCCFAVAADEGEVYYHYMKGDMDILNGDVDSAIKEYKTAAKLSPYSTYIKIKQAYAQIQGIDIESATDTLTDAIKADGNNIQARMLFAELLLSQKKYNEAIKQCDKVLAIDPFNEDAVNYKTAILIEEEKNDEAILLLKQFLQKYPDEAFAYYYKGVAEQNMGDTTAAENDYITALKRDKDYEPAASALMAIYERGGNLQKSIKKMEELVHLSPNDDKIIAELAWFCVLAAKKDKNYYQKAINYLEQLNNSVYTTVQIALIQEEMGKRTDAIRTLEETIKRFPDNEAANYNLAGIYDRNEQHDDAVATMKRVIKINPDNAEALNYVGYEALIKADTKKAKYYISRAFELAPENPYIMDSKGWLEYKTGDLANAKDHIESAVSTLFEKKKIELEVIDHLIAIYKRSNSVGGEKELLVTLTQLLSSDWPSDKEKTEIKIRIERLNEIKIIKNDAATVNTGN